MEESIRINISGPQEPVWEGWGCSLAWWAQAFGDDDQLADLLFTTEDVVQFKGKQLPGLGLNIVRYLAGTRSTNEIDGMKMCKSNDPSKDYRFLETFWKDINTWDFGCDQKQKSALLKAKCRGVNLFELFANSPPWWMLKNNNPSGAGIKEVPCENLNPDHLENFVSYLSCIVQHAKDEWGVHFQSVEAFNEPSKNWWCPEGATQEGCYFLHETQQKIIVALHRRLKELNLCNECKISTSDDWGYSDAYKTMKLFTQETVQLIGQWNVHGYEGKHGPRHLVAEMAKQTAKKLWNSEYGDDDASGLEMAWNIIWDFKWLKASAWLYWQPVDAIGGWGLIKPQEEDFLLQELCASSLQISSKFFILAHFTRHIRPGMKVLTTDKDDCLAAYDVEKKKLVIIALNYHNDKFCQRKFDLSQFARANGPITRWWSKIDSTEESMKYKECGQDLEVENGKFQGFFEPSSIQTFEIEEVYEFETSSIIISPNSPDDIYWEGWGCSLAWWASSFGNDEELANLLFTHDSDVQFKGMVLPGLCLNIVRYLAGATSKDEINGLKMKKTNNPQKDYRFLETFWGHPDHWGWEDADSKQRSALVMAQERGANLFELFANSPPWWMLCNQNPSGNGSRRKPKENLKPNHFEDYAFYLCKIIQHARSNWGVTFQSVAPFNEPANPWCPEGASQEGCFFRPETQAEVISCLHQKLNDMGLSDHCQISSSDDCRYSHAFHTMKAFDPVTHTCIGQFNVHGYENHGPRHLVAGMAKQLQKPVRNSEYGDNDPTGLELAWNLILDFKWLKPTAWCYWQPVDAIGGWGLIKPKEEAFPSGVLDPQDGVEVVPKFFVMAHFTRHIRPGMKVLETNRDDCIAAYDAVQQKLVIVAVNFKGERSIDFDLSQFSSVKWPIRSWLTTMDMDQSSPKYEFHGEDGMESSMFTRFFENKTIYSFEIDEVCL